MSINGMSFILGGLLVAIALLGGGFEVRELRIPSVGRIGRLLCSIVGAGFIVLAIYRENGTSSPAVNTRCAQYAQHAIEQYKENESRCNFTGARWQNYYENHYRWCLGAPEAAAKAETNARQVELNKCQK